MASVKDCVSVGISLWVTTDCFGCKTNSMGSSMVRIWSVRPLLMFSSIEAIVVDFPMPVGPDTKISPRRSPAIFSMLSGRFKSKNPFTS